jgi:hypothetical protein
LPGLLVSQDRSKLKLELSTGKLKLELSTASRLEL